MGSGKNWLALAIMFFDFSVVFSVIFWSDVSLAAKIGLFALGFGTGMTLDKWFNKK